MSTWFRFACDTCTLAQHAFSKTFDKGQQFLNIFWGRIYSESNRDYFITTATRNLSSTWCSWCTSEEYALATF